MDPVSLAGLAIGVASIGLQVYTGCIQGIQLLVTALGYEDDCKYLNLRLRMEQQRLFAWSETSGLLDLDAKNQDKILNSNVFNLHRQTVLDLLVQIRCLFDEFTEYQRKHNNLCNVEDHDGILGAPEKDAKLANYPMTERKRDFIKKAMLGLKTKSVEGITRLRWTSRFAPSSQNRDLSHLVLALKSQLDAGSPGGPSPMSKLEREANADALRQLSRLAKFKAFNETIDPKSEGPAVIDEAAAKFLDLAKPGHQRNLFVPRYLIEVDPEVDESDEPRCEALMKTAEGKKKVWIEWKDYDNAGPRPGSLSKADIIERVRKLAALLNHSPKPEAFRTPHCLGFFDKADPNMPEDDVDILDRRLGLIFERPSDDNLDTTRPPISLRELLQDPKVRKPRVTERVRLAHAISNCLLYLHAVHWLHKGLRSHNVLFFLTRDGHVDYRQPYLSGFDFSRPGGSDEMTDAPGDDAEHDLYRHPNAQSNRRRERERSKKSFDIYSLGVILVELAHWRPIEEVLDIDMRRARGRPDVVRKVRDALLAEDRVAAVGADMGERFEDATRRCLAGGEELGLRDGDDETEDEVAERLSIKFYKEVVKRLEDVVV
ncbi:hypothetical protein CEP52_005726 [Fusarium oligoseptatum]|uniref:Protein kinase domain-containing protein n=1 Tax=Fusarium oligoseptatum TaxID=2604345 RepID=A0A428TW64_9HYPO|nr:hypothetical protein CEP52_005726 [Fusarium oligoseptatum]